MEKIMIKDLLKGYNINHAGIQNVGIMTVVPLVSNQEYTPITSFINIRLDQDLEYNKLQFKNDSDDIGILLQGYTIISDQKAQDRTVPYPRLIKGRSKVIVPANCVEPHQGGSLQTSKINPENFKILPPSLRALAMQKSSFSSGETGALWESLSTWSKDLDLRNNGLVSFYEKFVQQLDEFVASFEPVEKQLGAITILNDEVIAIDIAPKYASWLQIFRPLIRDSYGAEACRLIQNKQIKSLIDIIDTTNINSAESLEKNFTSNTAIFFDRIKNIIKQNIELESTYSMLQELNDLNLVQFESKQFLGCGVYHGDHIVYLSLVSKEIMKKKEKIADLNTVHNYANNAFRI